MCDVCLGMTGCPVCTPEPEHEPCEKCDGQGYQYFYENPETGEATEVDKSEYDQLPIADRSADICEDCEGEGEIYGEMPMTRRERKRALMIDNEDYY